MVEPKRRWTDEFDQDEPVFRRIIIEERLRNLFTVYVEGPYPGCKIAVREVARKLTRDEAVACAALVVANGWSAPFLKTPAQEREWMARYEALTSPPPRNPWDLLLPERATPPEEMSSRG